MMSNNSPAQVGLSPRYFPPSQFSSLANVLGTSSNTAPIVLPTFRAPAHGNAHHLHSIPPREKSTRTLIIDHMLWVHGRTRFAQARAELGMTDRTGGPSSQNFAHRHRPEKYEEEHEAASEGEDAEVLAPRTGAPDNDDEEIRQSQQDLQLARALRIRAEGLEKVVTAMLDQPPRVHPVIEDDVVQEITNPESRARPHSDLAHPHSIPNGIRLRLYLGTIINDFFARYAISHLRNSTDRPAAARLTSDGFPRALLPLRSIASRSAHVQLSFGNIPIPAPGSRVYELYRKGIDLDTVNFTPSLRCQRHLTASCEICAEVKPSTKVNPRASPTFSRPTASGTRQQPMRGKGDTSPGGGISGFQEGVGVGSGLLRPGPGGTVLRRVPWDGTGGGRAKLADLIPRFLRLSALVAKELADEAREAEESSNRSRNVPTPSSGPSAFTSATSPQGNVRSPSSLPMEAFHPTHEWYLLLAGLLTRAILKGYLTEGWKGIDPIECLLTIGLGIGKAGTPTSSIAGTPNRSSEMGSSDSGEGEPFAWFDPDSLPGLEEAARILFAVPTLYTPDGRIAESEYQTELNNRLSRFYNVPPSTPDLSTHMEDLAWLYPAEPVERAAVRFCEAVARWRGKPELETYKNRPPIDEYNFDRPVTPPGAAMSLDTLLNSSPESLSQPNKSRQSERKAKPPNVFRYFTKPSMT